MTKWVRGLAVLAAFVFASSSATAHDRRGQFKGRAKTTSTRAAQPFERFTEPLDEFAQDQLRKKNPLPSQVSFISEVLTDRVAEEEQNGTRRNIIHRDEEITRIVDLLQRQKGKFPVVVGETGSGKTEVINELALRIAMEELPDGELFESLRGIKILKTSMRNFIPGGMDLAAYLSTIEFIQNMMGVRIMVVMQESHFANDYIVSVLREQADKPNPIPIILEVDSKSFGNSIKGHPSFTSIAETVMIREPKPAQVKDMLRNLIADELNPRTHVRISDEVLNALVDVSPDYRRDVSEPRRSETLLEDFMVFKHREASGEPVAPNRVELYRFVAKQIGLPVIPQNEEEFARYMQGVKERMKQRIIGQKAMVDGIVDQFIAALTSRSRSHSVALALGPTGVGKSLLPEVLAEEFYGDKSRYIELDMTQYKDASSMSSLFGANNGFVSSDKEKGVLCDFFDGRGKGGGIVVLNEIEEMSSDALTRFMEMWDKGFFPGGDGKLRYVGRTLFMLTSNKNSDRLLSYEAIRGMARAELDRRLATITQDQMKKAFTEKASYTEDQGKQVKAAVLERVDRLYFASPLLQEEATQISKLEIDRFVRDYHKQSETRIVIDESVPNVITTAFYNEALGARQIRTNVQQFLSRAINEYRTQHGFGAKELRISAKLHPALKTVSYITIEAGRNTMTIDGPKIPVANKLLDAEFRQRLIDLEKNMKSEVFGQDEAIRLIAGAAKARYLEGSTGKTVAGFLVGVTGSGKTELAKSLARHLYGRKEAMGLFEMGRIQHESDLNTILSPGKGIIGSDQPGELEQFLIQYPDGGVLLFDEMSNAGGANPGLKQAIAKQFYTLMDEGYYKSPSGKIYPLHNHIMLYTGNDGEEVLKGKHSDSMAEEAYTEAMKNPLFVKNLLGKAGFTDAFIGRLAFSHFMRPTLGDVKIMIATKLINEWRNTVQKTQPIDIELDENLAKEVGTLMFSPKTGARSIREFVVNVLAPLVSDEALKQDWGPLLETGARMKVKLRVNSIRPDKPFYEGDQPDHREAVLRAETYIGRSKVSEAITEFTQKASFMPQAHKQDAVATAYHEMAHAVTSFTPITGKQVVKITIVPEVVGDEISAAGYVQYRSVPRKSMPDRAFLVHNIAGLMAGSEAETLHLGANKFNVGRSNDIERVGDLARRMILEAHLFPELDAGHAYKDSKGDIVANLPPELRAKFDKFVADILAESRELALTTVKQKWAVIELGVQFLIKFGGTMSGDEYEKLNEEWTAAEKAGKKATDVNLEAIRGYKKPKCEKLLTK